MFNWSKLFSLVMEFITTKVGLVTLLILTNMLWWWIYTDHPRIRTVTTIAERLIRTIEVDTVTVEKNTIVKRFVDRITYKEKDPEVVRVVRTEFIDVMPSVEITSINVDPERMWVDVTVAVGEEFVTYGTNYTRSKVELRPVDSTVL